MSTIKQAIEALENYVTTIATAGGGDKQLFMSAIRQADEKARAALAQLRDPIEPIGEREQFEAWARKEGYEVDSRKEDGRYWSSHTHGVWKSWRAALAALRSMPAEPVAWYDVENGQIISAPRWYSDGGRTEAPLYATPPAAPVLTEAWKPIETAPDTGYMLVYEDGAIRALMRMEGVWKKVGYPGLVEPNYGDVLVGQDAERVLPKGYRMEVRDGCCENPTHWMPLPPPPAAEHTVPVPLSDDELWELWNAQGSDLMDQTEAMAFARAVEAEVLRRVGGGV